MRNVDKYAASPQLFDCEGKFEEYTMDTEEERENPQFNNEVRCQQANMRKPFIQRDNTYRCDPGSVSYSDCRSDMVYIMAC